MAEFPAAIKRSHAVVFVRPEHNRSIPGLLNKAIDQGSWPLSQSEWTGIVGGRLGSLGTLAAQQHSRNMLAYLDTATMAQPEVYPQHKESLLQAGGQIGASARMLDESVCLLGRTALPSPLQASP